MPNSLRFAVFVKQEDFWERRSALRFTPSGLATFMIEDDNLRTIPETDKDVLKGPEAIMSERRLPAQLLRELISKGMVEVVTP